VSEFEFFVGAVPEVCAAAKNGIATRMLSSRTRWILKDLFFIVIF
jgi:hypothetical protein